MPERKKYKEGDEIQKLLPAGMMIKKDGENEKDEGVIGFNLTKKQEDHDGDVVIPLGGEFDVWKDNPQHLWMHESWRPPIGKGMIETLSVSDMAVISDVLFDIKHDYAKDIYRQHKDGFLNAVSIRFIVKEIGERLHEDQYGWTISKWILLESSSVTIPANPGALQIKSMLGGIDEQVRNDLVKEMAEMFKGIFHDAIKDGNKPMEKRVIDLFKYEFKDFGVIANLMEGLLQGTIKGDSSDLYEFLHHQYEKHGKTPPPCEIFTENDKKDDTTDSGNEQVKESDNDSSTDFGEEFKDILRSTLENVEL